MHITCILSARTSVRILWRSSEGRGVCALLVTPIAAEELDQNWSLFVKTCRAEHLCTFGCMCLNTATCKVERDCRSDRRPLLAMRRLGVITLAGCDTSLCHGDRTSEDALST